MVCFHLLIVIILAAAVGFLLNELINKLPRKFSLKNFVVGKRDDLFHRKKMLYQKISVIFAAVIFFIFVMLNNWPLSLTMLSLLKLTSQLVFTAALILIFVIDFKHYLILDITIYPLMPLAFVFNWWIGGWTPEVALQLIVAALIGFVFYAAQFYLSKGKWVGDADMKLGALLGLMLGWQELLVALFIAYVGGSLVGLSLVFLKKKKLSSKLPMATLLCPAGFVSMLFSSEIINWYLGNFFW